MQLIDAHTHLQFPEFASDFDAVMSRAHAAGVKYLLNVGTNNETSWQAMELAKKHESCYAVVGVHPHEAAKVSRQEMMEFEGWLTEPKVVAIGEIGLDYFRDQSPRSAQREVLINFLKIADRTKKPIVLHIRDAYDDMIQILTDYFHPPIPGMSHCFSGTMDHMEQLVQLGLHISFSGTITYKKNDELRECAKLCPASRILIETDAPYLPPQSKRGQRNEPSYVQEAAALIADIKKLQPDQFGDQLVLNFERLFGIRHS